MKKNITISIGIVVLLVALFGGYKFMKEHSIKSVPVAQNEFRMKTFTGDLVRVFEGDNKLAYSFDIPETATTTLDMNNALVRITDVSSPYATVYISYEGGRGFSPLDYLSEVVAPHVSVINPTGTSTIGAYDWQVAESEGSEWHIAPVNKGQWLIVVENKKTLHDAVAQTLASLKAE